MLQKQGRDSQSLKHHGSFLIHGEGGNSARTQAEGPATSGVLPSGLQTRCPEWPFIVLHTFH